MKTKHLLFILSVVFSLSFLLTSCEKDGDMGIGGTTGEDPPPPAEDRKLSKSLQTDSIAVFDLTKE